VRTHLSDLAAQAEVLAVDVRATGVALLEALGTWLERHRRED
jgi:hypothetical protein